MRDASILGLRVAALFALAAATPSSDRLFAQQSTALPHGGIVILALATPETKLDHSVMKLAKNGDDRDLLVLRPEDATPERLMVLLTGVNTARQQAARMKDQPAIIRNRTGTAESAKLSNKQAKHYEAMIRRLKQGHLRNVPGYGILRSIDIHYGQKSTMVKEKKP